MNRTRGWMASLAIGGVAVLGIVALSSSVCLAKEPTTKQRSSEDFEWSGKVPAGGFLKIKGVSGAIKAGPSKDGMAHVSAVKHSRRDDPDEVRIEVEEDGDGITVCAIYPGGQDCDQLTGEGKHKSNDVSVDFTVEVPAGARLIASTVNGRVEALDLKGDAEVSTVNGSIEVETTGVAAASTVNGSIVASIGVNHWPKALAFSTVNGGITLQLPEEPDADLKASTVNGSITTDFPLKVQGKIGRRSLNGTLGKGGPSLTLTTVNGAIRLRGNDS